MTRRAGVPAVVAALTAVAALSWTAAEGGRGLDWSDFRTVVIVALAVLVAAVAVARRSPDSR